MSFLLRSLGDPRPRVLDGEPLYYPIHKLSSAIIQYNGNLVILNILRVGYELVMEVKHGLLSPIDEQSFKETNTPQHSNNSAPHSFLERGDSKNSSQTEGAQIEAPFDSPIANIGVFEKTRDFCTDKTITEVEFSDKVVCFKDFACHVTKDICVDDWAHSLDKILLETDVKDGKHSFSQNYFNEGDEKNPFIQGHVAKCGNDDVTKDLSKSTGPIHNDLKISSANGHPISSVDKDDADQCSSTNLLKSEDKLNSNNGIKNNYCAEKLSVDHPVSVVDMDDVVPCSSGTLVKGVEELDSSNQSITDFSPRELSLEQVLPLQELEINLVEVDSSSFHSSSDQMQPFELQKVPDQVKPEEGNSLTTLATAVDESNKSNETEEDLANLKVQGGVLTFDCDSGAAEVSIGYKSKENAGAQQSGQALNDPSTEWTSPNDATASARSSFVHQSHGEQGFPGPASLSGHIAFSGHIPYSGSISLRSDSSTTSARSFAFPILQSEWNSSPIKMVKADRRHLRKHRGWRMRLTCCRF